MKPRKWTADDTATLRRMAAAGYSDGEIARHIGRDREVVRRQRDAIGIRTRVNRTWLAYCARLAKRRLQIAA